jgi:hypothetical protein
MKIDIIIFEKIKLAKKIFKLKYEVSLGKIWLRFY